MGALVPVLRFWALARTWYAGRMDLDWRPKTPAEAQSRFEQAGLTGPFWQLT